jgi:hypothetical protein
MVEDRHIQPVVIVKDYLYEGDWIVGHWYGINEKKEDEYILDDGDVYPLATLERDYTITLISSNDIVEAFKNRFDKR